jgi:hypothetical protein
MTKILNLTQVIEEMVDAGDGDQVSGQELLEAFGERAYGPLILVPSLLLVSPLSAIPGFSTAMGLCIVLVAGQLALGRGHPWLPAFIKTRSMPRDRLAGGAKFLLKVSKFVDGLTRPRLCALTRGVGRRVLALVAVALGAVIPLMEVVPMASSTAGAAVAVLGLALTARDGLLALFAMALVAAVGGLVLGVGF